ncbi:MAG: methyltransferase [Rhodospirillaceae bacterium]|nr:methyltransferase [Rhodospirillaceae bacterium]|tara:strand:- start:202 stop:1038 length:837 start_codon:yes stop_codon:yes gene_type:complete
MAQPAYDTNDLPFVEASVNYVVDNGIKPVTYISPYGESNRRDETPDHRTVPIYDGRTIAEQLTLDDNGFEFHNSPTAVTDFMDSAQIETVYNAEVEKIVAAATGAPRVLVFDHTLRVEDAEARKMKKLREPVRVVHNDYTDLSGPQRVRDLLPPNEADTALKKRYVYINVWRSISGAVEEAPLGICDAQSIAEGDMILMDLKYDDRVGEIHRTKYNPDHRWVYFPCMQPDELILLKCFDTETDGRARWTAHSAFDDPTSPADAAPRQSIETRTIAFYD